MARQDSRYAEVHLDSFRYSRYFQVLSGTFRYSRYAEVHLDSFRYSRYFQVLKVRRSTSGFFSGEMARVAELVSASAPAIDFQYCQFAACAANTLTVVRHLSFNCHHTVSPKINFLLLGF